MRCLFSTYGSAMILRATLFAIGSVGAFTIGALDCSGAPPVASGPSANPNDSGQPYRGLVLLRDGGVLAGEITRSADRYVVSRGGGEINVPFANALLVCNSLEEAYEQQRAAIPHPTVEDHLKLAEWCLRHAIYPQAERELNDVRSSDPRHPKLALLERRLAVGLQAHAAKVPPRRPPANDEKGEPERKAAAIVASADQFDSLAEQLPPGAVQLFVRKVQPILVNNCTTSGCHQAGDEQSFQLDRALLHGLSNRRSTMQNLEATLALVDREKPEHSRLLTTPRRAHGGMEDPLFGPRHAQMVAHLVDWVALIAESAPPNEGFDALAPPRSGEAPLPWGDLAELAETEAASDPIIGNAAASNIANRGADTAPSRVVQASFEEDEYAPLPRTTSKQFGATLRPFQPRDPFDPEIFNRQQAR